MDGREVWGGLYQIDRQDKQRSRQFSNGGVDALRDVVESNLYCLQIRFQLAVHNEGSPSPLNLMAHSLRTQCKRLTNGLVDKNPRSDRHIGKDLAMHK